MESCDYFREIVSHFQKFRETEFLCDTVLATEDKELKAHSVLLAAASRIFRSTFEASGGPGFHYIHLPGYNSKVVEIALNVIYTGDLVLPEEYHNDETQLEDLLISLENLGLKLRGINDEVTLEIKMETIPITANNDLSVMFTHSSSNENSSDVVSNSSNTSNKSANKRQQFCIKEENGIGTAVPLEADLEVISEDSPVEKYQPGEFGANPRSESGELNQTEDEQIWNSGILNIEKTDLNSDDDLNTASQKKVYVCSLCKKAFSHLNYLEVHQRTHTGEKPFVCTVCGRSFSQRPNLNRHALGHLGEKPNLCHICGKAFIQKTQLDDHLHQHGDNGTCACRICSEVFADRVLLRQHVVRSHPKRQTKSSGSEVDVKWNVCVTCGKSYSTIGALRMHARVHTGQVVTCTLCSKSFVNRALLLQHVRSHTKEKLHECTTCGKSFVYKNALTVHTRIHTGEKPYRCSVCGHTYSQFGHLQSHKKTHTGERPFICTICNKAYRQKVDLRLHVNRVHKSGTAIKTEISTS